MKLISIVTVEPTQHPHASPETMERMAKLIADMRFLETLGSDATCYVHEVSPTP